MPAFGMINKNVPMVGTSSNALIQSKSHVTRLLVWKKAPRFPETQICGRSDAEK